MKQNAFFDGLGAVLWWPLGRVRRQFWSALWVLYVGAFTVCVGMIRVLIDLAFGQPYGINFEFIGHFIGSLGAGALLSSLLVRPEDGAARTWIRVPLFGGISGFVFSGLIQLKTGPPFDVSDCWALALITAIVFALVWWLLVKNSSANIQPQLPSNP